jgi:16S rRNA processing protein RimM
VIAQLLRPRGIKGELAAIPFSDNPERFHTVIVNGADLPVENVWRHGDRVIFKFGGVDSIEDAEKLAGAEVCIPKSDRAKLPQGEYFQTDLIGCTVVERGGDIVGVVTGSQEYGGPLLLEVDAQGREVLIPFARSICVDIDIAGKKIVVDLPPGLKDLNA